MAQLRELGLEPILLTGDAPQVAQAVASQVGISAENVYAGVTPEGKSQVVRQLQEAGHRVAMVAVAGLLNPMIAGAAMAFSSVFVVLNSMRLTAFRK